MHRDILAYISEDSLKSLETLESAIPIENKVISNTHEEIISKIMSGFIMIYLERNNPDQCLLIRAELKQVRQISTLEVEFSVVGPKESFVESLEININLIRKRIPSPNLQISNITVGNISKTSVAVIHIEGISNNENVNTVKQRIEDIDFDQIIDSSYITQLI